MFHKKYVWAVLYGSFLIIFTLYAALDTFAIPRVYTAIPSDTSSTEPLRREETASAAPMEQIAVTTENSYNDGNVRITITEYRENDTTVYVADVTLSSPQSLRTALAQDAFGRNVTEKTSEIAQRKNAILAINGDFYGSQENGYVIRNGILYRGTASRNQEDLVIQNDGSFRIVTEGEITAEQLLTDGAQQVLSFGPALLEDDQVMVTPEEEVGKAKASNPRTAIAIVDDLHYLFVVCDGRTSESKGLSLYELAEFLQRLGASAAYNLDGGGSSTLYFNGKVINNPTTNGRSIKERSVSDIVYISGEGTAQTS